MADTPDLGSGVLRRAGSSPVTRTKKGTRKASPSVCLFRLMLKTKNLCVLLCNTQNLRAIAAYYFRAQLCAQMEVQSPVISTIWALKSDFQSLFFAY